MIINNLIKRTLEDQFREKDSLQNMGVSSINESVSGLL